MNRDTVQLFLCLCIAVLAGIAIYQRVVLLKGVQRNLSKMAGKLKEILDAHSHEEIMVFTDNRALMELAGQINRLLGAYRKTAVDYRRSEAAFKKMLSNISHDIKTPMTVVLGYLEIMRLSGPEPEMLEKAEQKAQDVMGLINEFFTLAKLESGDMNLELSRIDASELCRETLLDFYELLMKDGFEVEVDIPQAPLFVQSNKEGLRRILSNLISNAIRYGADGHYLGIAVREEGEDGEFVCIDVSDKGKGIEKAVAVHVFDRLFTMEDSRSRQIQGNGLGLAIAKNLALQMGGDVTLESVPHQRTVFSIRLRKMGALKGIERNS